LVITSREPIARSDSQRSQEVSGVDRGRILDGSGRCPGFVATEIIGDQLQRLTSQPSSKLGFALLAGVAVSLWSANAGMKALFDALNVIYGEKEKRSFIRLNLVSLAFTLGAICFLDMLGVSAEFETNHRRERQLEGIAKAKDAGVYKGRPASATGIA
jgi:hypothetical protein